MAAGERTTASLAMISTWAGGLLSKIHIKSHVSEQGFSNMAFDSLTAVLPANQMPGLKIVVN